MVVFEPVALESKVNSLPIEVKVNQSPIESRVYPPLSEPIRDRHYIARSENSIVFLSFKRDFNTISQVYGPGPSLKVRWSFNQEGRISNISSENLRPNSQEKNMIDDLVNIHAYSSSLAWNTALLLPYDKSTSSEGLPPENLSFFNIASGNYVPLPEEIDIMNLQFRTLIPKYRQISKLINLGYSTAENINDQVKTQTFLFCEVKRDWQDHISDITHNDSMILDNIAKRMVYVEAKCYRYNVHMLFRPPENGFNRSIL